MVLPLVAISEIKPGVYSATVSSTRAGNVVVRAFSEQYQLGTLQQTLKFVAGPLDAAHSSITLNPDKPVVGGTAYGNLDGKRCLMTTL